MGLIPCRLRLSATSASYTALALENVLRVIARKPQLVPLWVGLSFQRPLDEWLWDTGFRVDLWLRPQASDLGTNANANDTVVLRQAYIDFRFPWVIRGSQAQHKVDMRVGAIDSPIGLESSTACLAITSFMGLQLNPFTGFNAMYQWMP